MGIRYESGKYRVRIRWGLGINRVRMRWGSAADKDSVSCYLNDSSRKTFSLLLSTPSLFLSFPTVPRLVLFSVSISFYLSCPRFLFGSISTLPILVLLYAAWLTPVSLSRLQVQCKVVEFEMNHIFPAFSTTARECGLQKEPLLFSCAGFSAKYRRVCPCRDFRKGQVALCQDCL